MVKFKQTWSAVSVTSLGQSGTTEINWVDWKRLKLK